MAKSWRAGCRAEPGAKLGVTRRSGSGTHSVGVRPAGLPEADGPRGEDQRGNAVAQVLVIGGAGFLGSLLCRELLERGHRVRVLDALLYGAAPLEGLLPLPGFGLVAGDTRDPRALAEALEGASALVHL